LSGQKMHADERDIDAVLVRRLVAEQFPEWGELPIKPVPSAGTDNALYRLGDDKAVRLPRIRSAVREVAKEHHWLPRLAPHLPLAIPQPLGKGEPAHGYPWPWSVYRWLDGENPSLARIADPRSLATRLAQFIAALHGIDPAGGPAADRGEPLEERDAPTRTAIDALQGTIDTGGVAAAWEKALRAPIWPGPPVWVHADLSPGNLLIADGRLSAVIDFGCLGLGDPACDLTVAWNLLGADVRSAFRAALDVDDATWERGRGWALSIALIHLPYYHRTNPTLAANARHVIGEILTEHRRAA
jgi:aminoglycoside phosphotransferase (APT) family kinase protein